MRLIPYIRVSTDEQAEQGHSLTAQEATLQRFAAHAGHNLADALTDEGVSAGRPLAKRKGGAAMLAALRAQRAQGVLVARVDRLFRDVRDALEFFAEAAGAGWAVVSAGEHIDTSTPAGRLQLNIMLATAQYEREIASVRTTAVSQSLRERGKVYGVVPYGCIAVEGMLVRDPRAWRVREQIIEWHNGRRYSLRTIRNLLHDLRIVSPTGQRWWSTSTLSNLIDTHETLAHLPPMEGDCADEPATATEAKVSHGSDIRHNSPSAADAAGAGGTA